jgi:CheY-like chemotaxis protein
MSQKEAIHSLRRLAAGLAHDLNNILGGVNSLASASLLEAPNDTLADDLKQIIRTTREGLQVAARLAIIGQSTQPKLAPLSLAPLLQRITALFPQATLSCPESLHLQADARLLQEAISALLQNAAEASKEDISVVAQAQNNGVSITVQNSFDKPLNIEECLLPYTSQKKEGRGKGLGLSIVQAVALAHNGELSLSQRGNIVTASLWLASGDKTTAKKERPVILLADDEKAMRMALERLLSRAGYQVLTSTNGQEALDLFREKQHLIDVILLDRLMPNLNGPEVAQELRRQGKTLPIFLLSGEIDSTEPPEALGVTALIEKPFEPAELLKLLQSVLPTQ